jgi:hypothetical protein
MAQHDQLSPARPARGFCLGDAAGLLALAGVLGTGRTSQLEDKQLTDPQQVAFSPRVPPPGLWVWLKIGCRLHFTER